MYMLFMLSLCFGSSLLHLHAQITVNPANSCSYSFVVNKPATGSTCESEAEEKMEKISQTISDLQDTVARLEGRVATKPVQHWFPFMCGVGTIQYIYRDCGDVQRYFGGKSGVYEIYIVLNAGPTISVQDPGTHQYRFYAPLESSDPVSVYCDLSSDDSGWLVIMRRSFFNVNFDRTWQEYKDGFGELEGDFWLGLQKVHEITSVGVHSLWIVIHDEDNIPHILAYDSVNIGSERQQFPLIISGYHSKPTDRISSEDQVKQVQGIPFVTKDSPLISYYKVNILLTKDEDVDEWFDDMHPFLHMALYPNLCANSSAVAGGGGGWWFIEPDIVRRETCTDANLNAHKPYYKGMHGIKRVEMKIRTEF